MKSMFTAAFAALCVALGYTPLSFARAEAPNAEPANDVIARVGDQAITFHELNTALNSSAIVGVSVPALGTPERDTVRVTLLDRFVTANLLYLDARKQGLDQDPAYQREIERFDNAVLADLYRRRELVGDIPVSDEEVEGWFAENKAAGAELTPEVRAGIESALRREKMQQRQADARARVRDGIEVVIHEDNLTVSGDAERDEASVIAQIDGHPLRWSDVSEQIVRAGKAAVIADPLAMEQEARRRALEDEIDLRIMARKARASGLERDPLFETRSAEFHKTRLINLYRERLVAQMEPTGDELQAYFQANKDTIVQPEARKIQMVVLDSRNQAEAIKAQIDAGEMTLYEAARDHSIAARAKDDLGEVGWVFRGDTVPALDEVIFALGPGEISPPVETPAGWHLVLVQDVQDAKYTDLSDEATRKLTRRKYLDEKLADYAVDLRRNEFDVEVYPDVLLRLAQQEADMVGQLAEKAEQPESLTRKRLEELRRLMNPPK